jgi:F-type H+-transporting ATPase subunit delta
MAELATIARPYAEALFRVAKSGNLAAWSDLVSEMAAVAGNPDVKAFAGNPKHSDQQIVDTFLSLLKSSVSAEAKNFIAMLVENGRLSLLPEIDTQVKELVATLERKFGRKLKPSVTVDQSLIGGVRVTVGDEVLDSSVRAKLQKMHTALLA